MKKSIGKKLCFVGTALIGMFVLVNIILTYFFMAPFSTMFYRDQMAYLSYYSLFAKLKAQDIRLLDKLINDGTVKENAAKNAISSVTSPRL